MVKKSVISGLLLGLLLFGSAGIISQGTVVSATSESASSDALNFKVNDSADMIVEVGSAFKLRTLTSMKEGTWSSSNNDIAYVNANGEVTVNSAGVCNIYFNGDSQVYTCTLQAIASTTIGDRITSGGYYFEKDVILNTNNNKIEISDVSKSPLVSPVLSTLDGVHKEMGKVASNILFPTFTVNTGTPKTLTLQGDAQGVTWSSNNPNVVGVNNLGVVTGYTDGEALITATDAYGNKYYALIKCLTPSISSTEFIVSDEQYLNLGLKNCIDQPVWNISDTNVVTTGFSGDLKATGKTGTCTISTTIGTTTLSATVDCYNVSIDKSDVTFNGVDSYQIPLSGEGNLPVTYESSNPSVIYVDESGMCHSTGTTGQSTVTVTIGTKQEKIHMRALCPSISHGSMVMKPGGLAYLEIMNSFPDVPVSYVSANEGVAVVSPDGAVIGVAEGETDITVTVNNVLSSKCHVKVEAVTKQEEVFNNMLPYFDMCLGLPYDFGDRSPLADTNGNGVNGLDCSGFVCWVLNSVGIGVGDLTAQGLYDISKPVDASEVKPGDLVFFQGTYDAGETVTHIGIYVGGGQMIHSGNPNQITSITGYYADHLYGFGRVIQ